MAKTYKITFNEDLVVGSTLNFTLVNNGFIPAVNLSIQHTWVPLRRAGTTVTSGFPSIDYPGQNTAFFYAQALQLDFGGNFSSIQIVNNNSVLISVDNNNLDFIGGIAKIDHDTLANVYFEIIEDITTIDLQSVSFSMSNANRCEKVNINIDCNIDISKIISPIQQFNINATTFNFDYQRGQNIVIIVEDINGNQDQVTLTTPSILTPNDFVLQINNSPAGASVVVDNNTSFGLNFQYSLDNTTWQDSNVFSGLVPQNYTVYIRDQFGCSVSKIFTVDEFGVQQTPFFYISKANSIRYAERVNLEGTLRTSYFKNDENTLSCEVDVPLSYKEVQLFETTDIITTQIKSNYKTNTAKLILENGDEVAVPVVKKSNYIANKDSRDARKYDLGGGKTGIYFTTGSIYNFDTTFPTGEMHYLNGNLPIWAKSGSYIKVGLEWFLIEDILFDENKNSEVIIVSNNYSRIDVPVVVGSVYNIFDYEIYEFSINMEDYTNQSIRVIINCVDPNFITKSLISEELYIQNKHDDTFQIEYWNDDNTDVFYATGIQHKIRIPYHKRSGDVDESSEVHKTDTNSILLNSELYEVDEFQFEPATKEIWRKLMIALSCKNVLIDGVGYVKNNGFDTDGPLEDSNLYVLTAKMIKTGNVFKSDGAYNSEFDSTNQEIPGLIETGSGGFLRY